MLRDKDVLANMFAKGDEDKDNKLSFTEFQGVLRQPILSPANLNNSFDVNK
jgi:hypothetical protein